MKKIEIYTTSYCPFCIKAKSLLLSKKIKFKEHNLSVNPEKFDDMLNRTNGAKTVPQIFVNDTHIGDCDQIHELENKGELDKILKI